MAKNKTVDFYKKLYLKFYSPDKKYIFSSDVITKLESDFKGFQQIDDAELILKIYSLFYSIYKQNSQNEQLENLVRELIPILVENKDYSRLGVCYKELSYLYRLKGNYNDAYEYIVLSLDNYKKLGDLIKIGVAFNSLGNFYLDTGEFNHALENYHKAYEHIQSFNDHEFYFLIKANLANIYFTLNYFSKAKELYIQDLDRLKENQLYARYAISLLGIGDIYIEENRLSLAYKYFKRAIENHEKSDDLVGYATAVSKLAKIYGLFGKYPEALAHYEKAKRILERVDYKLELLKLHNRMGETYLRMGDTEQAIAEIELAKSMALEIKQNFELRKIYHNLSNAYDAHGDKLKAYEALSAYTQLNEKMFSMSIQARLSEVQTTYEIDKKELELKKDLEISNHKLRSLQHQMNPHFIFNSMSTIQNLVLEGNNEATLNFISDFSQLMRTMMQHSRHDTLSLEDELSFLKHYIELELIRYHREFDVVFQIDISEEEWGDIHIPTMMIQPLIENAIKHGVSNLRKKRGKIIVSIEVPEPHHYLVVSVIDNGLGLRTNALRANHTSTALQVIEERLKLYAVQHHYGAYSIDFSRRGTTATINIPI